MRWNESVVPGILLPGVFTLLAVAAPAAADGPWEVGCHGGAIVSNHPKGGTGSLPAPGAPFTTITGLPSRRVSSWFFGDGAALLNQVSAARGSGATLTALDPVLTTSVVRRNSAGSFGCRTGRQINARYTAEIGIDYSVGGLTLSDASRAGIEASRAGFVSAFSAPLPPGQGGQAPIVTATASAAIDEPRGHQVFTTGVLHINLRTAGSIIPYASVGGGVALNGGGTPSAALTGNYRFTSPPGAPMAGLLAHDETDTVKVRHSVDRRAFVGVVGGGIKYAVTPRWGVRLDVRAHLSRNRITNMLDARASVLTLPSAAVRVLGASPAVQFSASTAASSTLSAPPLDGFQTFRGRGTHVQFHVAPGLFWRF
jgi:hypothetical protein